MTNISQARVRRHLRVADDLSLSADARGAGLEDLVEYLFSTIPGFSRPVRNALSGGDVNEVDVGFANARHTRGLNQHPAQILVECKNESAPAGAKDLGWFDYNLWVRHLDFGIFVAMAGITGTATQGTSAHQILRQALQAKRHIVVLTRPDLGAISSSEDLVAMLIEKETELVTRQTLTGVSGRDVRARLSTSRGPRSLGSSNRVRAAAAPHVARLLSGKGP